MENKFEKCVKCPAGTAIPDHDVAYGKISVEMDEKLKCQDCNNLPKDGNAHYTGPSNDITTCPWVCDKNYYKNSRNICTSCPPRHYTDYAGAGSIDQCKIDCAGGTYIPSQQVAIQLGCISCSEGMATGAHTLHRGQFSSCVSCNEEYLPTNATYSGAGSDPANCPWKCNAGYYKSGNICRSCSEFNTSSAQYSSHTGATSSLDCFQLPKCGSANGQYFIYEDYPNGPISNLCDWGSNTTVGPTYATVGELSNVLVGWRWNCQYSGHSVNCSAIRTNRYTSCAGTQPSGTSARITYGTTTYTGLSQREWTYVSPNLTFVPNQVNKPYAGGHIVIGASLGVCEWTCNVGYYKNSSNQCAAAVCIDQAVSQSFLDVMPSPQRNCYALSSLDYACNGANEFTAGCNCRRILGPYSNGCYACEKGNATCFIAGTKVIMSDGTRKNIEDIEIGEKVMGKDGTTNTVLGFHKPLLGDKELWSINGGEYFVTAEHPFMTTEGWKSLNPELSMQGVDIEVTLLNVGDILITDNGEVEIYSLESKKDKSDTQLYNLLLDGDHTYYANGYLVHNKNTDHGNHCMGTIPSGTIEVPGDPGGSDAR